MTVQTATAAQPIAAPEMSIFQAERLIETLDKGALERLKRAIALREGHLHDQRIKQLPVGTPVTLTGSDDDIDGLRGTFGGITYRGSRACVVLDEWSTAALRHRRSQKVHDVSVAIAPDETNHRLTGVLISSVQPAA